ncbi:phenylalanyl-tRNA synthetase beta subunit [Pseudomonas duriflava]|uniref:Phenylalanine--tRNA ligase beta subunit n=1 Tax=Pseudomonas duriflava TaxID=459528 RepID=A0A562PNV1_9PSED|nr:phenylalanine--tRNA ligase subunit beta [Pseudomonas duriflava]TWI45756.1 phenylalanyl-tRNA synthetase beta subunit [Pseudomonas duriflava]
MKFSEQWLRSWVNPPASQDELVTQLSMAGLEVDSVEPVAGLFSGVVVGEVLATERHPDADKLSVCRISNGQEEFQVVCGAPNVRAGLKVPFAMIGAKLPGDFTIKKAKLRGVESQGMLCSASELKVSDDNSGLMELPSDAPVGASFRDYLNLDDVSIEVDLTPNRGDCLSIAGLAREVGALYGVPVQALDIQTVPAAIDGVCPVDVLEPSACPRYVGRVLKGVDLSRPTPLWMIERLRRSGIRSIDAAVDVTNYVMLELGQPMHAFDLGEIKGGIQVRLARPEEKLALLDGQEVALRADTLVIADHDRALAIAGIMGGEHGGVSAKTSDLFLESAFFDPIAVAGKARSYGLHTDSSHRFERGVDFELPRQAIERATALLMNIVGGQPGPVLEVISTEHLPHKAPITLRSDRIEQVLGLHLEAEKVEGLLKGLGLFVKATADNQWQVSVPSHRFDISIEVDLIEELARLYGYNQLPVRFPQARLAPKGYVEACAELSQFRRHLVARGYQEVITYSFIDESTFKLFSPTLKPVLLANPISQDMAAMRASLWPGLVKVLQYNLNRQQSRVRLFESGLRFIGSLDALVQERMLAGLISGPRFPESWSSSRETVDFFDIKGDVEALLSDGETFKFIAAEHPALHPGQTARIERDGNVIGYVGALHPELLKALDLDQPVYVFELLLSEAEQRKLPRFQELSRYPEVRRDLAILVDESVASERVLSAIRSQAGEYLTDLRLFDVYQGKGIDPHRKSLAVGLTWQHPSRTLTDEEINETTHSILVSLEERFNATLRK